MHEALEAARPVLEGDRRGARPGRRGRARARQPRLPAHLAVAGVARAQRPRAARAAGARRAQGVDRHARHRADARSRRSLDVVYPGIWLDDGVYATHGHYLDRHVTVPSFERLGAGVLGRLLRAPADRAALARRLRGRARADVRAARRDRRARRRRPRRRAGQRVGRARGSALSSDGERDAWRGRALVAGAFPLAHRRAQPARASGRCEADLSGAELRRASLRAMGEVVARLRHRRAPRDLRPHPPLRPAARRRRRRVAAGRRRAARSTPAAGSTSRCTSTATGAARTGPAARSSSTSGGEPRFVRLLRGRRAPARSGRRRRRLPA